MRRWFSARSGIALGLRGLGSLALMLCACAPRMALSQTPLPMQEWQYSQAVTMQKLFQPDVPEWQFALGAAVVVKPLYDGASRYRVQAAPVINVRYRDIAFASLGEGLGVNILRGDNYRAGVSIGYDLGRTVSAYSTHLQGLGDIAAAPVVKLFGAYVVSKAFPLLLRADIRQFVGGAAGWVGDFGAALPLPGSSKTFIMFAGPSFTFASRLYMQKEFGVSQAQASASGYPVYDAHAGSNAIGLGFSATRFITQSWLVNVDAAVDHLLGSASESPITQHTGQSFVSLAIAYRW